MCKRWFGNTAVTVPNHVNIWFIAAAMKKTCRNKNKKAVICKYCSKPFFGIFDCYEFALGPCIGDFSQQST